MPQYLRHLNKDRYGSALLGLLGLAVVVQGRHYRIGSLTQMGAGFMPVVLGSLLMLVALAIGLTSPAKAGDHALPKAEWRGWACILGGTLAFVVFGTYGGLVPATFLSVFIAALGDRNNTVKGAALLAAAMVVAGVVIFSVLLRLQLQLFAWG